MDSGCGTLSDLLSEAVGPEVSCKTCPRSRGNSWLMCCELHRAAATLSQWCLESLFPVSCVSPRLKAWSILEMPARATERFGNELQNYKRQIPGFWCIHSIASSVSTRSRRTGDLGAQGTLHCWHRIGQIKNKPSSQSIHRPKGKRQRCDQRYRGAQKTRWNWV